MSPSFAALCATALVLCGACSKPGGSGRGDLPGFIADGAGLGVDDCTPCLSNSDCVGQVCVQLAGDSYCAPTCVNSGTCASDESCISVSDTAGDQVSVCVDNVNVCGSGPAQLDMGSVPTDGGATQQCGTLVGPNVKSTCDSCSGNTCQTNGCYGGWWCNTATSKCQSPPTSCSSSPTDGGTTPPGGGFGTTPTGSVGPTGGTLSRLLFAVVGDSRPPSVDDTSGYPTAIVTKLFSDVQAMSARPAFILTTGDYQYSTPTGTQSATQLATYMKARGAYTSTVFPAMGNHECTGYTTSNCIAGSTDLKDNNNYSNYLSQVLAPIGQTQPYYAIDVNAADASWTAKLVFIAANAWDATQSSWLATTLAKPTTYTFIVRHEPTEANTAPGVTPSDTIIAKYPYTIVIVGHTHTYDRSAREVIIGNGGAPLTGSRNYGYAVFSQQTDGSITIDMVDYSTNQIDTSFHFAVKADGTLVP